MKDNEQFLVRNKRVLEKQQDLLVSMMNDDRYMVKASTVFCNCRTSKKVYNTLEQSKITFGEDEGGRYILFEFDSPHSLNNSVKRAYDRGLENLFVGVEILIIDKKSNECVMGSTYISSDGMRMCSPVTLRMYNEMVFATKNK